MPTISPIILLILSFLLTLSSHAHQINWRGIGGRAHEMSDGTPLGATFVFEIGSFSDGFVPTPSNTAEWQDHWQVADRTSYREEENLFVSSFVVESSNPTTPLGGKAYIWGYDAQSGSDEWILIHSETWIWPRAGSSPFPKTWVVSASRDQTVIGTLGDQEGTPYIATAPAEGSIPVILASAWQSAHFTPEEIGDEAIGAWLADPDQDGWPNQLEFALGTDPWVPQSALSTFELNWLDEDRVGLSIARLPDRLISVSIHYSDDHSHWLGSGDLWAEGFVTETLRIQEVIHLARTLPRRFYRLQAEWLVPPS